MKRLTKRILFFTLFAFSISCGEASQSGDGSGEVEVDSDKDESSPDSPNNFAMVVQSGADQPACDTRSSNQLIYVMSETAFKTCDGTSWVTIDIKGEKGEAGAAGAQGEQGEAGSSALNVDKKLFYSSAAPLSDTDVNTEGSDFVYISDIHVTEFDSGYALLNVAGNYIKSDVSEVFDFEHTAMLKLNDNGIGVYRNKLFTYANSFIWYSYDSKNDRLGVTVDVDANVGNNPADTLFQLSTDDF
jgi:hypothetical protein